MMDVVMNRVLFYCFVLISFVISPSLLTAASQGPIGTARQILPGDKHRLFRTVVNTARHQYEITMNSEVDGSNCQSPVGYKAFIKVYEPNIFLRMENVGETDVINPWLTINNRTGRRNLDEIIATAVKGLETDRDKARAIWEYHRRQVFHATTWDSECSDPIKAYNVYGYTICNNDAEILSGLWQAAGLKTAMATPPGHVVSQVLYDGSYHLFDGDEHCFFLKRDNKTVASDLDIVRDHDLIKRTHTYGILEPDNRFLDEFTASLYSKETLTIKEMPRELDKVHTMDFKLRPEELIEWRWDHIGKEYIGKDPGNFPGVASWGKNAHANLCNGKMIYRPDLKRDVTRRGTEDIKNIVFHKKSVHPKKLGQPSHVIWKINAPYVIVGGTVKGLFNRLNNNDVLTVSLSSDGRKWENIWTAQKLGILNKAIVLDDKLSLPGNPQYMYFIRVDLISYNDPGSVGIRNITFETDLQMAPLSLPALTSGINKVEYHDKTNGNRQIRVTHSWVDRSDWHPPDSPQLVSPANNAETNGLQVRFCWQDSPAPDNNDIVDYHIQVSDREDMRWPLSPNFDKLLSQTKWKGKTEWTVPYIGLLNPGKKYFWRVRAKNVTGVWSQWSQTYCFSCLSPGVPSNLELITLPAKNQVYLTWQPSLFGTKPVKYKIFASNEKGFTISDRKYQVRIGRGFCRTFKEWAAKRHIKLSTRTPHADEILETEPNYMATTPNTKYMVAGPGLEISNANKAYYRVVAVDENGRLSGPSDYAEAPRPFIYSKPPLRATLNRLFVYQLKTIYSLGDLSCKGQVGYKPAFWDREYPVFSMLEGPAWLVMDKVTGRLSGRPGPLDLGRHRVTIRVTSGDKHTEQSFLIEVIE